MIPNISVLATASALQEMGPYRFSNNDVIIAIVELFVFLTSYGLAWSTMSGPVFVFSQD